MVLPYIYLWSPQYSNRSPSYFLKFQISPPLAMPHIPQPNNIVDINILEEKLSLYEILNVSEDASLEEIKVCDGV